MSITILDEDIERFVDRILVDPDGCWTWTGSKTRGYGILTDLRAPEQQSIQAHRFAYEWLIGPIPSDLQIDHLCRKRDCVNAGHLEPVTARENLRRSDVALGIRTAATSCVNGHTFTPENTYIRTSGRRACRACKRDYDSRVYYADIETARAKGRESYHRAKGA